MFFVDEAHALNLHSQFMLFHAWDWLRLHLEDMRPWRKWSSPTRCQTKQDKQVTNDQGIDACHRYPQMQDINGYHGMKVKVDEASFGSRFIMIYIYIYIYSYLAHQEPPNLQVFFQKPGFFFSYEKQPGFSQTRGFFLYQRKKHTFSHTLCHDFS